MLPTQGGDGSRYHVDEFVDIVNDYCLEKGYSLKLAKIYADVDKAVVHQALKAGTIRPCTNAVPELTAAEVDAAVQIVAQMGQEPFLKAMRETPDFDVLIAGRAYDPAPYAAYSIHKGITNMGTLYNMGKVMD